MYDGTVRKNMYALCSACIILLLLSLFDSFRDVIDIRIADIQFTEPNEILYAFAFHLVLRILIFPPILLLAWNHILANTFQVSKIKYSQALVLEAVWMLFALVY